MKLWRLPLLAFAVGTIVTYLIARGSSPLESHQAELFGGGALLGIVVGLILLYMETKGIVSPYLKNRSWTILLGAGALAGVLLASYI